MRLARSSPEPAAPRHSHGLRSPEHSERLCRDASEGIFGRLNRERVASAPLNLLLERAVGSPGTGWLLWGAVLRRVTWPQGNRYAEGRECRVASGAVGPSRRGRSGRAGDRDCRHFGRPTGQGRGGGRLGLTRRCSGLATLACGQLREPLNSISLGRAGTRRPQSRRVGAERSAVAVGTSG